MTDEMTLSLPSSSIDAALNDIESRVRDAKDTEPDDIIIGPFRVLKLRKGVTMPQQDVLQPDANETVTLEPSSVQCELHLGAFMSEMLYQPIHNHFGQFSPGTIDSFGSLDDSLQWGDLFGLSFDNALEPLVGAFESELGKTTIQETVIPDSTVTGYGDINLFNAPMESCASEETSEHAEALAKPPLLPTDIVMAQAQRLLRHFKSDVIPVISSLPMTSKSLWEILNFNEAVNTFANLTCINTEVTQAKSANLYAILAISAYHILKTQMDSNSFHENLRDWQAIVDAAALKARNCLRQSLSEESSGQRKAKYKDQLMAILALMTFSVISGKQAEARSNLIDAERLVRLRGLAKRTVSRKARLLHHIYTWYRILAESTYVLHEYKTTAEDGLGYPEGLPYRSGRNAPLVHAQPPVQSSEKLDDFLRFRNHQADADFEYDGPKEKEFALRDIHLEDSRDNPNTMYSDIFGISETWLSLLSQTTRLANRLGASRTFSDVNASSKILLQQRADRLEDMVCSFASNFSPTTVRASRVVNYHFHSALNSALVILFYRRIRNVNAWILQSHVDDTIRSLESYSQEVGLIGLQGWSSVWPAFIAGSEASTPTRRERFQQWIEQGVTKTGLNCYRTAKELLNELWGLKTAENAVNGRPPRVAQPATTWIHLCREKKLWIMACR